MEQFVAPPRARRRAYLDNVRRRARKKAWERYLTQFQHQYLVTQDVNSIYRNLMCSDGHWIDGGCSRVGCYLCHHHEPPHRDRVQHDAFDCELVDWLRGELE